MDDLVAAGVVRPEHLRAKDDAVVHRDRDNPLDPHSEIVAQRIGTRVLLQWLHFVLITSSLKLSADIQDESVPRTEKPGPQPGVNREVSSCKDHCPALPVRAGGGRLALRRAC